MQYLLLIYTDDTLLDGLAEGEYDTMMRGCLQHADALQSEGTLLGFQQLEHATTAKTVRTRGGRTQVFDGPFSETKEMLAGFNLIEADSEADALRIAGEFPWARTGSIEVRAVRDVGLVRTRVGA